MSVEREQGERTLYGFWLSPYMALVAHVLEESGLPFRYERVSPFAGGTTSAEHKARNPLGKVPTLEDSSGLVLSESQAICRYLARTYPQARKFYPCDDPERCAAVDAINDFLNFSISGPFFNWFVVGAYAPKAWRLKTESESQTFSTWSMIMTTVGLGRLKDSASLSPFLLGSDPVLPDFHLFHILHLGRTFSETFDMPALDLAASDEALQGFYEAMASRASTQKILAEMENEYPVTRREIFEEFADAQADALNVLRPALQGLFGHEV
jgi:glutathione S-transferase